MPVDEFEAYGVSEMADDRVHGFLSSQQVGVLGIATDGAPSMRPLSYWYDGESTLYFQFLGTAGGRKATLSTQSEAARFLVYRAETRFNWRSVLLTGTIDEVPADEREAVEAAVEFERPDALAAASDAEEHRLFAFHIDDWTGLEHLGLPPEFEDDPE
ncbi:pyridoxamine 5'-phosphate oxidase family protein [Haloglomus litoreum]|uniref:pyridoxamine 5'-phosphate oxidase family protein n=1 Tax=Haloglomus litoreum TaxID=3034026 RepID=UPI0023E7FF62|nr:pyridoxamine 5'-phosphate oxidase family protein [Haloglomus sp. DT116]